MGLILLYTLFRLQLGLILKEAWFVVQNTCIILMTKLRILTIIKVLKLQDKSVWGQHLRGTN
jgi:hypothetical protein